jgi:hypothetical protein
MLTTAQLAKREGRLTASHVRVLMNGTAYEVMDAWKELIGDPAWQPKDFSGAWPVQLGNATEQLHLDWYERKEGRTVSRRGEVVIHPKADWACCTLDGFDVSLPGPIEAKHVGGREARSTVIERYQPQIHWQMLCTETSEAVLSIIEGADEPAIERISLDKPYADAMWERAEMFMACVNELRPPVMLPQVAPPVEAKLIIDMTGSNEWAVDATRWLDNIAGKRLAEASEKALKSLVPDDAARAFGHGVQIIRDKAGRLSLKEMT